MRNQDSAADAVHSIDVYYLVFTVLHLSQLCSLVAAYTITLCFVFSIDATHNQRMARFVIDSPRKFANCCAKPLFVDGMPHVVLFAAMEIEPGTELRYDYGGTYLPWRKVRHNFYLSRV